MVDSGEARFAFGPPPRGDGVDGKGRRIARRANADEATIARHVIDAIRDGAAECIMRIVVNVDRSRLARPHLAGVLEVAHELAG